ncbi:MAG: hypothetical protein LZF86_110412 [Nitrospira sp.]|nr:MAG: hypothetical protein LZF86_110412 [Nitrospira sp.]
MENSSLAEKIFSSLTRLGCDFRTKPFRYLTEADLQATLFDLLKKEIPEEIEVPVNNKTYKMPLVHSEYHSKVDLACLDRERSEQMIRDNQGKPCDKFLWTLPLFIGIELKLLRYEYKNYRGFFKSCLKDMEKLGKISQSKDSKHWLALAFIQNSESVGRVLEQADNQPENVTTIDQLDRIYLISPSGILRLPQHPVLKRP